MPLVPDEPDEPKLPVLTYLNIPEPELYVTICVGDVSRSKPITTKGCEPEIINEPVITADPENGNPFPDPPPEPVIKIVTPVILADEKVDN